MMKIIDVATNGVKELSNNTPVQLKSLAGKYVHCQAIVNNWPGNNEYVMYVMNATDEVLQGPAMVFNEYYAGAKFEDNVFVRTTPSKVKYVADSLEDVMDSVYKLISVSLRMMKQKLEKAAVACSKYRAKAKECSNHLLSKKSFSQTVYDEAQRMRSECPELREGQSVFNAAQSLYDVSVDVMNDILNNRRKPSADCFYDNRNIDAFLDSAYDIYAKRMRD